MRFSHQDVIPGYRVTAADSSARSDGGGSSGDEEMNVRSCEPSNKRMDQPSAYVVKGSGMTARLALIRVRSPIGAPAERIARRSCADR